MIVIEEKIPCLHPNIAEIIKRSDMQTLMQKGLAVPVIPYVEGKLRVEYKGMYYDLIDGMEHYHRVKERR